MRAELSDHTRARSVHAVLEYHLSGGKAISCACISVDPSNGIRPRHISCVSRVRFLADYSAVIISIGGNRRAASYPPF